MPSSLSIQDLYKDYPTPSEPLQILKGISLELSPGQSLAIVGPSGSGKSTLLNIIGTLDHPTAGSVRVGEVDPFSLSGGDIARFRAQRIGFIFQDHHLLPQCTALENVLIPRLAAGRVTDADVGRAQGLLERVGLSQRSTHLPSELSGGERQRVAIARALVNSPLLLLCDEPTGNLDPTTSRAVGELLTSLAAEGNTILLVVTHSEPLSRLFQQRRRMDEGRLIPA